MKPIVAIVALLVGLAFGGLGANYVATQTETSPAVFYCDGAADWNNVQAGGAMSPEALATFKDACEADMIDGVSEFTPFLTIDKPSS